MIRRERLLGFYAEKLLMTPDRLNDHVKQRSPETITKSGLMLGLGETTEELFDVLADLVLQGSHLTFECGNLFGERRCLLGAVTPVGIGLLERDGDQAVSALLQALLRDQRAQHVAQQGPAARSVEARPRAWPRRA